jgi:regulator of sigma E protease
MSAILTILGIGLLLLIHEGGHYLAARAVGIRVKVFALGFGPRLFGWQRNGTDFRISLLPLGGYVQVAGSDPSRPPRPGDLFYAGPAQRLLFYSGGILANFAFAFLLIPILFSIGIPFVSPTIGSVASNSPAWQAGLRPDDIVQSIGEREIHGFRHISSGIALAEREELLLVNIIRNEQPQQIYLAPEFDSQRGFSTIGVGPAFSLSLAASSPLHSELKEFDTMTSINGHSLSSSLTTQLALESLSNAGSSFAITAVNPQGVQHTFTFQSADYFSDIDGPPQLGVTVLSQQVEAVRGDLAQHLSVGDTIKKVNGAEVTSQSELVAAVNLSQESELRIELVNSAGELQTIVLSAISPAVAASSISLTQNDVLAFTVHPLSAAAAAGLATGCSIIRADNTAIQKMDDLRTVIANSADNSAIDFQVIQPGGSEASIYAVQPAPIPQLDIGLMMATKPTDVVARNPLHAIQLGYQEALAMIGEVTTTAKRLFTGEVASKNMGGIISIGVMTNSFASQGMVALLFFLCLISVNLAVLNFLPIPALDGGHILFALYEIITRRKVSLQVQNVFQVVGVILVLSLLVFVTTNDIQRLLG